MRQSKTRENIRESHRETLKQRQSFHRRDCERQTHTKKERRRNERESRTETGSHIHKRATQEELG